MQRLRRVRDLSQLTWLGYPVALAFVAIISLAIVVVTPHARYTNLSMLYLIAVLVAALTFGRGPAVVASIAAFFTYDWFFIPPVHQWTISDLSEWVALVLFLITALITGQLTAAVRQRAVQAEQREAEVTVLYDVVRLLASGNLQQALPAVADRVRQAFDLAAVVIELNDGRAVQARATSGEPAAVGIAGTASGLPRRMLSSGTVADASSHSEPGRWVGIAPIHRLSLSPTIERDKLYTVPVRVAERRLGTLTLLQSATAIPFRRAETRTISALSTQLALAVERVRLLQETTEADVLQRTDLLKTSLMNAVSHDLRTPLASIIASAGSLRQRDVAWTDDERAQFAVAIEEEALRLNRIVGNLLDLSRIDAGSLRPAMSWYDLGTIIDGVVGRSRPRLAGRHIDITCPENLSPIWLDGVEIDQVLTNLLENAIKHTPAATAISVIVRQSSVEVEVEMADDGPGIPAVALPHLFDPFFRVDVRGAHTEGTGVGLTVAKGLVEAHGGRIWAENRPQGGAAFHFTVPMKAAPSMPLPVGAIS
jgi:two-component system sensor histidine kinase KdpD